ncbi:ribose-5-phosphate isomerase [Nakamurella panacisegetis]|uniref:Ribose 5-phosphate isomerase A n=1 Tax=Nakamurella panacisegetis TaxID=1090615 RepID=A0A1H0N505_9ACTN|nr:ribose 5-phosphate isomerase A [Nakamurella panacisegetis]SDO87779.1 ribose-5-phosphate isomerase [Nakamurella panacisegetis]
MTSSPATPAATPDDSQEGEKRRVAEAAALLVEDGMLVGLGTGSTVAYLLPALARRQLDIRCVSTSPQTEAAAAALGLAVGPFGSIVRFDIAIDGADQVTPDGWLVKGGGAAHTREKIVAATSDRFVVIADSSKAVDVLRAPIPVELLAFGLDSTLRRLGSTRLRDVPPSPDGGVIADFFGAIDDPAVTARFLRDTAGLVEHGIFPPELSTDIILATGSGVVHRTLR